MTIILRNEIKKRAEYFKMMLRVTKHSVKRKKIEKDFDEFLDVFDIK